MARARLPAVPAGNPFEDAKDPTPKRPFEVSDFVEPQLATLVKAAPEGDRWSHELKYDGYRILARLDDGRVRLASRNGNDWTARLPAIRDAIGALPARAALLDGEAAVLMPDGTTRFQAMQNAAASGGLRYFAFDLLHLDGVDLRPQPLEARKAALAALLDRADSGVLVYSDHVVGRGAEFFRSACQRGLEGIVSKRRDARYSSGRSDAWVKTKCVERQELVIGGFTDAAGSKGGLGALLVGHHEGRELIYAGKVGTGFQRSAVDLFARLRRLGRTTNPFVGKVPGAGVAHWVVPTLVCEVEFIEWTADGRLRHPSFKGLRTDKRARDVVRERALTP